MGTHRSCRQPDLFAAAGDTLLQEPPPADFIARIRGELADTLVRVREAAAAFQREINRLYLIAETEDKA